MIEIRGDSREFLFFPLLQGIDTGTSTIEFAVLPVSATGTVSEPAEADWHNGAWAEDEDGQTGAQVLVGPDTSIELAEGLYQILCRVTTPSERPVRELDLLRITG